MATAGCAREMAWIPVLAARADGPARENAKLSTTARDPINSQRQNEEAIAARLDDAEKRLWRICAHEVRPWFSR